MLRQLASRRRSQCSQIHGEVSTVAHVVSRAVSRASFPQCVVHRACVCVLRWLSLSGPVPAAGYDRAQQAHAASLLASFRPRDTTSLWSLFLMVLKRSMVQHSRSKISFAIDNILVFVAALFLALVYFNSPVFVAPQPSEVRGL